MTSMTEADATDYPNWFAVFAIAGGIFMLVSTELLPVGLLTGVAAELQVSDGQAGLMVTVPGLVAAFAAPVLTLAAGRYDRRLVLWTLMSLLVLANVICAVTQSFVTLLAARVLVGLSIGGFWALAGGLAQRLVPRRSVGRATALIFSGVAAASVIGVPAGSFLGEIIGWRAGFLAVAAFSLLVLLALIAFLPRLPAQQVVKLETLPELIGNAGVRTGMIATFLLITGHFTAYTFARPLLQESAGIDAGLISTLLLAYGIAGLLGNFLAGSAAPRNVRLTLLVITGALAIVMILMASLGHSAAAAVLLLVAWGLAYGGVSVSLQTWMLMVAPHATEGSTALFVSTFNLSIALGAFIGGLGVDQMATSSVLWLGASLILFNAVVVASSPATNRTTRKAST